MARVLVVDDSALARKVTADCLQKLGHTVVGFGKDGNEGVDQFKKNRPEIMFLDVTMPNKDGRECLEEVLAFDPEAKVIMLTAVKDSSVVAECLKRGAKGYLEKSSGFVQDGFEKVIEEKINSILR